MTRTTIKSKLSTVPKIGYGALACWVGALMTMAPGWQIVNAILNVGGAICSIASVIIVGRRIATNRLGSIE